MPIEIQLPRLGWSMEEGKFLAWLKNDGDLIHSGDPLFTLESDKAAQEVESIDSGILSIPADGPKPGDVIKVGCILGYLLADGEIAPSLSPLDSKSPASHLSDAEPKDLGSSRNSQSRGSGSAEHPALASNVKTASEAFSDSAGKSDVPPPASPRARRAAVKHRVDLCNLTPTGRGGRLRERDVLAAVVASSTSSARPKIPLTPLRRAIADRLMHSRQSAVPVTVTMRCDATELLAFRRQLRSAHEEGSLIEIPTLNDLFIKLAASALRRHPMIAAIWAEDHLLLPEGIHLGITVDTGAGLLVPVIRDVDSATLTEVATRSRPLIEAARTGSIAPADLQGACFTVSNLGALGVESFTPVINPPQSAILGIGSIVREAVPRDDGTFFARDRVVLSLTFDHRVNDGADAARFLQTLRQLIQQPLLGLV